MLQITELFKAIHSPISTEELIHKTSHRYSMNEAPVIVWNVNKKCNMSCPHCYISAQKNPESDGVNTGDAFKIIDSLKKSGVKIIIFSGGEPLLRDDLFELIRYAKSLNFSCHLSSNGVLIDQKKAHELKEIGIQYVGISIDGIAEFNNSYRGLDNAYNLAMNGLRFSREAGLSTGIRITLSKQNQNYLFPLIETANREGFGRFYISHLLYSGRAKYYAKHDLSTSEARYWMIQIFDFAMDNFEKNSISLVTGGNDSDGSLLYLYVKEKLGMDKAERLMRLLELRGGNSAGEKIFNVDCNGDVHPDQFWQIETCGNLLKNTLEEISKVDIVQKLKKRNQLLEGKCSTCKFLSICRGSHRERAFAVTGNIWASDPACYLTESETL